VKRRTWLVALAVALVAAVVSAIAATTSYAHRSAKSIEVLSLWSGSEKDAFIKVTTQFTKQTGIDVKYTTARDFVPAIRTRLAAGDPPDVAIIPRPGVLQDFAKQGSIKDLGKMGFSSSYMTSRYGPAWIALAKSGGKYYGLPAKANSKTLVFYRPDVFKKYKLKTAATWTQLVALTKKLKSKGQTPWAQGAKDSWTLTDWFENAYLRTAGPTKYQNLFTGKLSFTDPSVKTALRTMMQILQTKYLAGGVKGALGTTFVDGIGQVFGKSRKATMYMEGGFVAGIATDQVNKSLKIGKQIDDFPFPIINKKWGRPLLGAGDLAAAFKDSPEIRQFLKFISSANAGNTWVSTGAIISPNKLVGGGAYPNALVRKEAAQVKSAKLFRFDGSDLLPGSLGDDWGSTLQGILQSPGSMNSKLSSFQAKAKKAFSGG
jgi:alpha-glucoside transport system substrate-binding protein